jgi:hypothetical protein
MLVRNQSDHLQVREIAWRIYRQATVTMHARGTVIDIDLISLL